MLLRLWKFHHLVQHPAATSRRSAAASNFGKVSQNCVTSLCQRIPQLSLWKPALLKQMVRCLYKFILCIYSYYAFMCIHDACFRHLISTWVLFSQTSHVKTKSKHHSMMMHLALQHLAVNAFRWDSSSDVRIHCQIGR